MLENDAFPKNAERWKFFPENKHEKQLVKIGPTILCYLGSFSIEILKYNFKQLIMLTNAILKATILQLKNFFLIIYHRPENYIYLYMDIIFYRM